MTSDPSTQDVVVTGIGLITPAGRGVNDAWSGVLSGKSAATRDEQLEEMGIPVTISCRVPSFDATDELGRQARRLDRFTHLAMMAADEAIEHAGLPDDVDLDRTGIALGSGIGGAETWAEEYPKFIEKGPKRVSPFFVPKMLSNMAAGTISMEHGMRGPNLTVNTACAAGATAIHLARDLLRSGTADVMLAGGVEAGITGLAVSAFAQMGALSTNEDPGQASRPFDADRDGFVMAEGAGVLILETREHAESRGAEILAVVAGAGASADAHHQTAPPEDGGGAILAMERAMQDAGMGPEELSHINAHGTSTPLNDSAESRAVRSIFGDDAPPITSTKGVTGHLLGAAGAVEAAFSILSLRDGLIPPTANHRRKGEGIDLDVVAGDPRESSRRAVLSNSFGFGGQNAALVLTTPDA